MARVSNDFDVRAAMGLTGAAQSTIEEAEWVVLDAQPDYKYENVTDEDGATVSKKTDSRSGTTVLLGGPRKGDSLVKNKNLTVKLDKIWTEAECNAAVDVSPVVHVKVDKAVVWGSSTKGSTYVNLNLSIHATLIDENGQEFDPANV